MYLFMNFPLVFYLRRKHDGAFSRLVSTVMNIKFTREWSLYRFQGYSTEIQLGLRQGDPFETLESVRSFRR